MVLPFQDASLDEWAGTSDKEEMVKLGTEHILKTAEVASELEIKTVVGFFGSTVWESWYIWPPQRLKIYEEGWDLFVERWNPILDVREARRALRAQYIKRIAYNVYTAGASNAWIARTGVNPAGHTGMADVGQSLIKVSATGPASSKDWA
jgi:hypothetical protein